MNAPAVTPSVSVIADDLSGAASVGAEFARCGLSTVIVQDTDALRSERAEVVIFDTESRYDATGQAREKARAAGRALREIGAPILLKKFDSLLRGPIGHEIDAIMDSAELAQCVFIGAAPKMGRITVGGYQLVDGLPLAERMRSVDPTAPAGSSFIPERLARETGRPVLHLDTQVLARGGHALAAFFANAGTGIIVADSSTQADLNAVVAAAHAAGVRFFAGSYGMGEALRSITGGSRRAAPVLLVAGSTSEMTRRQVARLEATLDARSVVLDLDASFFRMPLDEFAAPYLERLRAGHDILLHTSASHEAYDRVRRLAVDFGISDTELVARVETLLQRLVGPSLARCKAFVFSGGNTAQSVYRLLHAKGLTISRHEVLPGTPVAKVRGGPYDGRLFLTKPGSFGTADDLAIMLNFAKYAPEADEPVSGQA
jgi:D-threonate/D-erythronate kinase